MSKVRQQYQQLKKRYPNAILFFQLGDFYETFEEDAKIVSGVCGIVLTRRDMGDGHRWALAGVPVHAADNYVAKLLRAGHRVAMCQQIEASAAAAQHIAATPGIASRDVMRVVTPGTVVEPSLLEDRANNYLAAVAFERGRPGLAYADITTGEFAVTQLAESDWQQTLRAELGRLGAAEVLRPAAGRRMGGRERPEDDDYLAETLAGYNAVAYEDWHFATDTAREALQTHFGVASLEGFGCAGQPAAIRAAGALVQYLQETQRAALARLGELRTYSTATFMALDAATRRNLELTQAGRNGGSQGSLLNVLDLTVTPLGGRLLRRWLGQPLLDLERLNARLDASEELAGNGALRAELVGALRGVGDLERGLGRVVQRLAGPRELLALRRGLAGVGKVKAVLESGGPADGRLAQLAARLDECTEVGALVDQAIVPEPPATLADGGVIAPGFAGELDALHAATADARRWVADLERAERERTGLRSLKVGYNKVYGYFIEVTNATLEAGLSESLREELAGRIEADPQLAGRTQPRSTHEYLEYWCGYTRRQTLVNAERFITEELKDKERVILSAQERMQEIEAQVYREVCEQVAAQGDRIGRSAEAIARLDVFAALAEVASRHGYTRPVLDEGDAIEIEGGRHPSVELSLPAGAFVANDCHLGNSGAQLVILTGPNMAGKSTYLRQVALITLMAQIGSFVPARRARIGLVDRIFTRVGAQDDIATGQSTFLVEMAETATILNHATARSLVVLDEVGRGTSTFDGMAIARAVAEYIHNHPKLGCKTLFATHYHELTELEKYLPRARNYRLEVLEEDGQVTFLHRVAPGTADRSYGIYVARLAGVPRAVTRRAEELLRELENGERRPREREARRTTAVSEMGTQLVLFGEPHPVVEEIKNLDLLALSPLEALTILFQLQQKAGEHSQ
ncbi:MAG: DNA mismatch repair protein MutS [Chloroflexota bacterium]